MWLVVSFENCVDLSAELGSSVGRGGLAVEDGITDVLEDGVDLNKYSNALAKVGINVLDATGNLRDMNSILDEMGQKWSTLSQT